MKKLILFIAFTSFVFVVSAQNETKLFRNVLSADRTNTGILVLGGDTVQSVAPSEGQTFVFTNGKYINKIAPALSADSMTFDTSDGILRIWRNGFSIVNTSLDGRYLLIDEANLKYMLKATYDPAEIAEQLVGLTATQTLSHKTLLLPIIANFINAQHDHSTPEKGGPVDHYTRTITLPVSGTVAGRIAGAIAGPDYPSGWTLTATDAVNLTVQHTLAGHKLMQVDVWENDNGVERLARPFSDAWAGVTQTGDTFTIEGLDTIELPLRIELTFR